jgi:uncharacterized membrane protein YoaK (UPF0700 family)
MRAIILAALVAVGVGLATSPSAFAAPAAGFAIGEDAQNSNVQKVQHWRWGSRRNWRRWNRCHGRHSSRWFRC